MERRQYIFGALMFAAAAVLIVIMLPRGERYLQNFQLGGTWKGEALTAPFDFSVSKSESEIYNELQHYRKNYIPVYTYDPEVFRTLWSSIEGKLLIQGDSTAKAPEYIHTVLSSVYEKGIVQSIDHYFTDAEKNSFIRIENEGVLHRVPAKDIFTTASAREYLRYQLPGILQSLDMQWPQLVVPNLTYSQSYNSGIQEQDVQRIASADDIIYKGEVIAAQGELIDQYVYDKLNSLKEEYRNKVGVRNHVFSTTAGYSLIVILLMGILFLYLYYFHRDFFLEKRNVLFIAMLSLIMVGMSAGVYHTNNLNAYLIPFAIVPVYILAFFDVRVSVITLGTLLLLCSLIVPKPLEFIFINFIGGLTAVFVLGRAYQRARIFMAAGAVFLCNCVCYLGMTLIQEGGLAGFNFWMLLWFAGSALLFLVMYQLVYLFEKMFGFVSDITLFELNDTNHKLLSDLSRLAPGTFQHTLQVANLAEAAAKAIGARSLLTRTGALYHDIGKMGNAGYFTENQGGGNNPHDKLSPQDSAAVIRRHVTDGVAMARKHHLPSIIVEFITGHHGDSLIYYFYARQKEMDGGAEPDQKLFRYDGDKPTRREVSIVMMADSVEAASRSLPVYTEESIAALVDKIIDTQLREGALADSELSLHDIRIIKEVFKDYISTIYHARITYPEREVPADEGGEES